MRVNLKGVHRVRKKLSDGTRREYHYAWRGGPKFWDSASDVALGSPEYIAAFQEFADKPATAVGTAPAMIDAYLSSIEFRSLGERTQKDYKRFALSFADSFSEDPAAIFEDPASRGEVNQWRQETWGHSPKQYDYAGTVATVILNWAREDGRIREHHCDKLKKVYKVDRSEIVWTPADLEAFAKKAPKWVNRILVAACETGLRPGDLIGLSRAHIEPTPKGRQIKIRTRKRKRLAFIPVTPGMAEVIDATPADRLLILVNSRGKPLTEEWASKAIAKHRALAELSDDLHLQDARGTAATRLLRADLALNQIASHMGWSIKYASSVIEHYATVSPDEADEILTMLAAKR